MKNSPHTIIGRKEELQLLQTIYESDIPEFLVLYGRRRIGKTYLISEFFKNKGIYFEITGIKDGTTQEQLFQFAYEFSRQFNQGTRIPTPKSWGEAFNLLNEAIEKAPKNKKIILFFDEVPWMASAKSRFLAMLEHFWNRYLSRNKNVILIICGSASSWIIKNIINNKAGLHGRVTRKIRLLPFTLSETEQYLNSRHIELDRKQIIDLYLAIGGVPKYLLYVERGKSAAQIVNDLCFSPNGGLYNEFNNLYKSLFDHYELHLALIHALVKAPNGLTKNELLEKAKLTSGGSSSKIIQELIDSGFVAYVPKFGKRKAKGIYRLIDEYSIFYLTWIESLSPLSIESANQDYWLKKYGSAKWNAWSGCAFESVCLKHIQKIKNALGISSINTIESGWRYYPKQGNEDSGAQIDLVIDRADKCINLCEMKYSDSEFILEKAYANRLLSRKNLFKLETETNKTLFTTLVTTYGAKKNASYLSIIDNQLTMDDLF